MITSRSRFFLNHDRYPDEPGDATKPTAVMPLASAAPIRQARATNAPSDQLVASESKTVTIEIPDQETRAAYRRAVHGAKQYSLVLEGFVLRHSGRASGDLAIRLLDAEQPDETSWNRTRLHLRKPAPKDLGQLLDENPADMGVSESQRARARQFLLDLGAEAARHGHLVKLAQRGQHAKLGYVVSGTQRSLELSEEYDEVPRQPAKGRSREHASWQYTPTDRLPSGRLQLRIRRAAWDEHEVWVDDRRGTLEKKIRQIIKQVQAGFDEDERARAQAGGVERAEERRRAAEKIEGQDAMDRARPQAVATLRQATLIAALHAWRDVRDMREVCSVLGTASAAAAGQLELAENLAAWRDSGLALTDTVDPTCEPAAFGSLDSALRPTPDDLRPYLGSPDAPRRSYSGGRQDRQQSRPWPAEWSQLRR